MYLNQAHCHSQHTLGTVRDKRKGGRKGQKVVNKGEKEGRGGRKHFELAIGVSAKVVNKTDKISAPMQLPLLSLTT